MSGVLSQLPLSNECYPLATAEQDLSIDAPVNFFQWLSLFTPYFPRLYYLKRRILSQVSNSIVDRQSKPLQAEVSCTTKEKRYLLLTKD